jgi:hypothetical protein
MCITIKKGRRKFNTKSEGLALKKIGGERKGRESTKVSIYYIGRGRSLNNMPSTSVMLICRMLHHAITGRIQVL